VISFNKSRGLVQARQSTVDPTIGRIQSEAGEMVLDAAEVRYMLSPVFVAELLLLLARLDKAASTEAPEAPEPKTLRSVPPSRPSQIVSEAVAHCESADKASQRTLERCRRSP